MKPVAFALATLALAAPTLALAANPALTLLQGDIFTDPVGTVIGVSVLNGTTATIGSAVVTCAFTAKGKPVGSSSTTIYNIVAGDKGQDQVHLMGATADGAQCAISSTTPSN